MLSSKDIRNVKFSKSVGGYKQEEVEILLDKVEADYDQFERMLSEMQEKNEKLAEEIESYRSSQTSIQNVLISAQRLADQMVEEAKTKSAEIVKNAESSIETITAKEKELTQAFDRKASERKAQLQTELDETIRTATEKSKCIEKATEDSVKRQQMLFDKLKLEVSAFKADITKTYKEHLELLQKIPDEVPMDPEEIARLVSAQIDKIPDVQEFIEPSQEEKKEEQTVQEVIVQEQEEVTEEHSGSKGFIINTEDLADGE
ncbi:MAG: DivIVA domain-containing protein [Clostridia bacterium]|nr:DivIVA domain-containing protein [Clostridia bacterium]